jgi:hypothetical protein
MMMLKRKNTNLLFFVVILDAGAMEMCFVARGTGVKEVANEYG